MKSDDQVLKVLDALKHVDSDLEAPARVEAALLDAFRERHRRRGRIQGLVLVALAAGLVLGFLISRERSKHEVRQEIVAAPVVLPPAVEVRDVAAVPARAQRQSVVRAAALPREVVTDFFPLMDVAPPLGRGELLRVTVPASAMRSVGLPVREERLNDRVQADVLVGEEGMARAIRFVSFVQQF